MSSNLVFNATKLMISRIIQEYMEGLQSAVDEAEEMMSRSNNQMQQAVGHAKDVISEFGETFHLDESFVR